MYPDDDLMANHRDLVTENQVDELDDRRESRVNHSDECVLVGRKSRVVLMMNRAAAQSITLANHGEEPQLVLLKNLVSV